MSDEKQKTYYAKTSIGNNMKTGQPMFKKGDQIKATESQLANWIKWGMVDEQEPKTEESNTPPRTLPIFPIKKDIDAAKPPKDAKEDEKTREEAEGLLSKEQEEQQEKEVIAAANESVKNANKQTAEEKEDAKLPPIEIKHKEEEEELGDDEEDEPTEQEKKEVLPARPAQAKNKGPSTDSEPRSDVGPKIKPKTPVSSKN